MSLITRAIYKITLKTYMLLPFKKQICLAIKRLGLPHSLFYKDFKFSGKFKVILSPKESFVLYNHGGTIENEIFWNGLFETFEHDTGWIWIQLCKCSETIFDIGANTGLYSMVAKATNTESRVYAFEPSRHTYYKLALNNRINKYDIKCEQVAMSNKDGQQTFYDTPDHNQLSASLSPDKLKNYSAYHGDILEYQVKTNTLSSYIEDNNIANIDLMKIDIEMHEPEAIQGLGKYLLSFKPICLVEVLDSSIADKLNGLIDFDEFFVFHLRDDGLAEQEDKFYVYPGLRNFLLFHRDLRSKVELYTTISFNE